MKIISLILLLFGYSIANDRQANAVPGNPPSIGQRSSIKYGADTNLEMTEATAYKMLYDNQVKSNSEILKTIFYALGALATAILMVFGSNWWFNEKKVSDIRNSITSQVNEVRNAALNEIESRLNQFSSAKEKQINELQIKLMEEISNNLSKFQELHAKLFDSVRTETKNETLQLQALLQSQIRDFNETYRQQFAATNENMATQLSDIKKALEQSEIKQREFFKSRINLLERLVRRNEFYMWKYGGVLENAFLAQMDEMETMLENHKDGKYFDFYLQQVGETLGELKSMASGLKPRFLKILDSITDLDPELKKWVLEKLSSVELVEK